MTTETLTTAMRQAAEFNAAFGHATEAEVEGDVVTDAGMDALRAAGAQGMPGFGATEAGDASDAQAATAETRWTIDSEDKANWYLRKLRRIEDEIVTIKAQSAEMIRGLEADRNRLNARHEADFHAWAKEELTSRKTGKKTLPLFQGTVAFRTVPSSLRVSGAPLAIEESKSRGWDLVKTVESLDAEGYRKEAAAVLRESGEVLPGVEIVPERESVSIRFAKKGEASDD